MPHPHLKVQVAGTDQALAVEIQNKRPVGVGVSNPKNKKGAAVPLIVGLADHASLPVSTRKGEPLAVSLGAGPLPVTHAPAGLPPELCSGVIALRLGKKEMDYFQVEKTHGQWAFLTPVTEEGPHKSKSGWYHLSSVAAGPWTSSTLPVAKAADDAAEPAGQVDSKPAKSRKPAEKKKH